MNGIVQPSPVVARPHPLTYLISILDAVNASAKLLVGLLLGIATLAVAYQISVRFVLDHLGLNLSAPWTEEIARYALIWAIFLGAAVVSRSAGLIAVEMLPQTLPSPYGKLVKMLSIGITIGFFCILAWVGMEFAADGSIETSPVMRLPMSTIYAAMPVGSVLTVINLLVLLLEGVFLGRDLIESDPELVAD
jgi:TRAP-type C4-dicarboxylate transport system permease small subunit